MGQTRKSGLCGLIIRDFFKTEASNFPTPVFVFIPFTTQFPEKRKYFVDFENSISETDVTGGQELRRLMMSEAFDSIKKGLEEAIEYSEGGFKKSCRARVQTKALGH